MPNNLNSIAISVCMLKKIALIFLLSLCVKAWAQHTPFDSETIKEPVNVDSIMQKAQKRINYEYLKKRHKESYYYLRLSQADTAEMAERCTMEAIIKAGSCINLHYIEVLTGKFHEEVKDTLEPQSPNRMSNNFLRIIHVAPMMPVDVYWWLTRTPFINSTPNKILHSPKSYPKAGNTSIQITYEGDVYTEPWGKGFARVGYNNIKSPFKGDVSERYEAFGQVILNSEGKRKTKVVLQSKQPNKYNEVVGTLYLDEKLNLSCFDGELLGKHLWIMKEGERTHPNSHIHIDYTRERGFDEIKHSRCEIGYGDEKTIIELFNIGNSKLRAKKKVSLDGNLPEVIRKAGYDPALWENEAVKKAIEESTNNYQQ